MIIRSIPQTIQNRIVEELREVSGEDKIASLRKYYSSLKKKIDTYDEGIFKYQSADNRIKFSKYFYFPTESKPSEMNCFERSASLYVAFHELYKESNPSLMMITDIDNNVHASVVFTHDKKLWGSDPSFGYFGEIQLNHNSIIVPKEVLDAKEQALRAFYNENLESDSNNNADPKTTELKIPFKKISSITGKSLENLVETLRNPPGIVDFVYDSGQIMGRSLSGVVNKYIFLKITPEGNIISDIRVHGESHSDKNACFRVNYNPFTKKKDVQLLRYSGYAWGTLPLPELESFHEAGTYKFGIDALDGNQTNMLKEIIFYLGNIKENIPYFELKNFANHPTAKTRFKAIIQSAQEIDDETYIKTLHYLRCRFGPAEKLSKYSEYGIIITIKQDDYLNKFGTEEANTSSLPIDEQLKLGVLHLKNLFEEASLAHVPSIIKMFDESKKCLKEAEKYVLENRAQFQ